MKWTKRFETRYFMDGSIVAPENRLVPNDNMLVVCCMRTMGDIAPVIIYGENFQSNLEM